MTSLAAAAEPAVELALDHAAQRGDRGGIADHGERLDGGCLDAEVAVGEQLLDPLADVARLAIVAAAHELRERTGGGAPALRRPAPVRAVEEERRARCRRAPRRGRDTRAGG